MENRLSQTHNH